MSMYRYVKRECNGLTCITFMTIGIIIILFSSVDFSVTKTQNRGEKQDNGRKDDLSFYVVAHPTQ